MDPVQLMMAAHQADATVAAQTPDQALQAAIAQSRPDLWAPLSTNPAAYPDLLGWLASTGNVEVLANLRARGYLTDDAVASAAGGVGDAGAAAAADSAAGEPTVDPAFSQGDPAQTVPTESAESAGDGGTPVDEDEAADEPGPVDGDEVEGVAGADSGEAGDDQKTDEPAEGAEDAEAESQASEDPHVKDAAVDESADERSAEPADEAEEPGTDEPAEDSGAAEAAAEPDAEDSAEETTDADDSGEVGDEQDTDEPAENSNTAETAAEPDAEPEVADEVAADADEVRESGTDQPEDEASGEQAVDETAVDESADERDAATAATELDAEDAAVDAGSGEAGVEPETEEPAEDSDAAETAVDSDTETATDEAADSDSNAPTVLAPVSQWHEVDSADTTDVTASVQSAAVTSGWTAGSAAPAAGSAAPAAGSAESVAFPVPPPPSAEDIAAWAETPSGAPSGFSAAQPAVELDMFGPQMMAQMPPPQQKQPSKSSSGRLIAIIVVLLLVIVGGGGLWAGSYFANKDKSGDTSQDKADSNGGEDGKQKGQADAAATSTAAALPSGAVKACSSMPTFTITSVEDGQGELKVHGNMTTSCAEGDFLAGSSNQVLVYSSTSPTGGADVDSLVASGTFDLSSEPLIIPNGGRAVTLRFGEQHYFRTAKDLDLKGLTVRPSFDRGSSSTATAKSSTNSAMTIASSASSNANQETQDEQAAGDAIGWQVKHDYPIVMNSMRGKWTPQLSSKQVGLVAEGQTWTNRSILAEFLKTRQANPKAVIIDTSQWPVYDVGGWWVTLSGELYDDADQANAWCDAQGYDSDHCLAKRIESNGTSQGTTKTR